MKKNIELLINILEKSKISTLEVSSFWGFRKIKLSKNLLSDNERVVSAKYQTSDNSANSQIADSADENSKPSIQQKPSTSDAPKAFKEEIVESQCVEAPLVGTVYLSAKPDEPQFINEGDTVKKGQVICIIEAMKIFNEIESDKEGIIKRILVKNEDPIEFGQPLIEIES